MKSTKKIARKTLSAKQMKKVKGGIGVGATQISKDPLSSTLLRR